MATVTDLAGSEITQTDENSVQVGEDSNINVFEFGNLILADLFPSIIAWINYLADLSGIALSLSDEQVDSSVTYDFNEYTYEQIGVDYEGHPCQFKEEVVGSLSVIVDMSGS
jgi:hypothetical protein